MMDIPFPLQSFPVRNAEKALKHLSRARPQTVPVLLGDADIFSTEWAETVDVFDQPEDVLAEALTIDIDAWFNGQANHRSATRARLGKKNTIARIANGLKYRLGLRTFGSAPVALPENPTITMLKSQLAELERAGEGTAEELADIRQIIMDIEADGTTIFPDPIDYITPRRGKSIAAGLFYARAPWEAAAWLQHGTYAACAPKPVLVALCKWLWDQHRGRIITASTDHIGVQMHAPIQTRSEAETVLFRFSALGASEVNADHRGSGGASLVGAPRLWIWWD